MSITPLSPWFKEDFPWWPAAELVRRLVFVTLAVVTSTIESDVRIHCKMRYACTKAKELIK